jgi:hypothetical protein
MGAEATLWPDRLFEETPARILVREVFPELVDG